MYGMHKSGKHLNLYQFRSSNISYIYVARVRKPFSYDMNKAIHTHINYWRIIMAKRMTMNERNILVQRGYEIIREEGISKLSSEMKNNPKYLDLMSVRETLKKTKKEVSNLTDKLQNMHKEFNESLDNEYFELANCYAYHFDGDFRWDDKGLRNKIETEVVLASLSDSVDFDKLIETLKAKLT